MVGWKEVFPKEGRYYETEKGILYCGDCLEILKEFPSENIDLVLTDPPYINMVNEKWDRKSDKEANKLYKNIMMYFCSIIRWGGKILIFGYNRTQQYIFKYLEYPLIHRELLVIDKGIKVVAGRKQKLIKCIQIV